ncbi:MAG: HemK/PrmC family methyltransferase [Candidatus Peregrinibacteria bacterium]
MSIRDALQWGHEQLLLSSGSARLDAELLLSHVLKKPVTFLLAHDDTSIGFFTLWRYRKLIFQRKGGVPVAYLTGHKEFYFLDFEVNCHVLVPRPDTEVLAGAVIEYVRNLKHPILLDVGTGSACIAVSVLKNVPGLRAFATDISRGALRVGRRNAKKHGVSGRVEFFRSDLLSAVPVERLRRHEVVVAANLPYIPTQFQVNPETKFEPPVSLYGGEDGLDIYKRLMEQFSDVRPRAIFLECFEFQLAILRGYIKDYELKSTQRMTGQARMVFLERKV